MYLRASDLKRHTGLEVKGVPSQMLRAPVTCLSFHPQLATSLAATLQSGVVLFWDTRREVLDSRCVVRADTRALVYGAFHPYLPVYVTLSQGGAVNIWPITSSRPLVVDDSSRKPCVLLSAVSAMTHLCVRCDSFMRET